MKKRKPDVCLKEFKPDNNWGDGNSNELIGVEITAIYSLRESRFDKDYYELVCTLKDYWGLQLTFNTVKVNNIKNAKALLAKTLRKEKAKEN